MVLLIVDPQVDFVSGSLAVEGAPKAMKALAEYMAAHRKEIKSIVVTMDQHPADHCSFVAQGGQWPSHCVRIRWEPLSNHALRRLWLLVRPRVSLSK